MRRIVVPLYDYSELSDEAKDVVRAWYLDDPCRATDFSDLCNDDLSQIFPNSNLAVQFSLGYSQGDGLNIYGDLCLEDVLNVISDRKSWGKTFEKYWDVLTEEEIKAIREYDGAEMKYRNGGIYKLPYNTRYAYCIASQFDMDEMIADMEDNDAGDFHKEAARKVENLVIEMFTMLAKNYEKDGYKAMYDPEDTEIGEYCTANNWEFYENGSPYFG